MTPAFADPDAPRGADAHRTLAEQLADPCVIIEYRPGASRVARAESFGGPMGPEPLRCVKTALRDLQRRPETVDCDPDDTAPNLCWILAGDDRLARIAGLTPNQINDALLALIVTGWEPNANREDAPRLAGRTAADLMPSGQRAARQARFL